MNRDIRMKGTGTVHFTDEQRRPMALKGTIIVDFTSVIQPPFVKVEVPLEHIVPSQQYLMPFERITYIEWETIEQ